MKVISFPIEKNICLLALGAESAGVFAIYKNGEIFISRNFSDILLAENFQKFKKQVLVCFKKIKPKVILTDLHPLYNSTIFGEELTKKYKIPQVKIQHHLAHIFSAVGDRLLLPTTNYQLPTDFIGIASDGTGYGLDGNIWGGEVFKIQKSNLKNQNYKSKVKINKTQKLRIERIGSLEEQIMIGGDLAVREPARMLIAILAKISAFSGIKNHKNYIYSFVKRYYTRNEFELLYNQLEQNFNCQKTTSTGRILDAVAVLLGFAGNQRKFKHEAAKKLEENSGEPYFLEPKITFSVIASDQRERSNLLRMQDLNLKQVEGLLRRSSTSLRTPRNDKRWILQTTPLFEYLIKNINRNKKRLAATAQEYIAKGFYEIINLQPTTYNLQAYFAGGMANNKIISSYLEKRGIYTSKKIPRGDEGIAVGQIVHYLLDERN